MKQALCKVDAKVLNMQSSEDLLQQVIMGFNSFCKNENVINIRNHSTKISERFLN